MYFTASFCFINFPFKHAKIIFFVQFFQNLTLFIYYLSCLLGTNILCDCVQLIDTHMQNSIFLTHADIYAFSLFLSYEQKKFVFLLSWTICVSTTTSETRQETYVANPYVWMHIYSNKLPANLLIFFYFSKLVTQRKIYTYI